MLMCVKIGKSNCKQQYKMKTNRYKKLNESQRERKKTKISFF